MTPSEEQLLSQMSDYDNLEEIGGGNRNHAIDGAVGGVLGNPVFTAQFTLRLTQVYYDETGAAVILPAALPAALQVNNPVYVFGKADFSGTFNKSRQAIPFVNGGAGFWNYLEHGIVGKGTLATASSQYPTAVDGDLVFISQATVAANVYTRIAIVHCPNVAYGTLLDSISSDTFRINMIRYTVDPTLTAQLANQISILRQTLFGKTSNDTIDPQAYITGNTFNRNISDIPLEIGVDKNLVLGMQMLFNVQLADWVITVQSTNKLIQKV